jgi:hypothetical protein
MKFSSIKTILISLGVVAFLFLSVMIGGTFFLSGLAGGISEANDEAPAESAALVGSRAPYFDLPNLAGNHVTESEFADTPTVILFWATWSEQSTDALHIVDEYLATHPKEAGLFSIVTINSQEEKSLVSSFMRRGGYQTPVVLDTLGKASEAYHIKSLPTFYFIDRMGILREAYAGVLSASMLGDKIESILK